MTALKQVHTMLGIVQSSARHRQALNRLREVRRKLPQLWDRARGALGGGKS